MYGGLRHNFVSIHRYFPISTQKVKFRPTQAIGRKHGRPGPRTVMDRMNGSEVISGNFELILE